MRIFIFTCLVYIFSISILYSFSFDYGGQFSTRLQRLENYDDLGLSEEDQDGSWLSGYLQLDMLMDFTSSIEGVFVLDSREVSQRTIDDGTLEDRAEGNLFIEEGYVDINPVKYDWMKFRLGKQHLAIGDGNILNDYQIAFKSGWDLDRANIIPLKIIALISKIDEFGYFTKGRRSTYTHLQVDFPFSFFESTGLFFGWFQDRDDVIGQLLGIAFGTPWVDSKGNIRWLGLTGNGFVGDLFLSGNFIYEFGLLEIGVPELNLWNDITARGYLIDINANYNFTKRFYLGGFIYISSGDNEMGDQRYNGFLSIYPLVDKTNIFFSGGISEFLTSGSITTPGVNGHGVISIGIKPSYYFMDELWIEFISAYLQAEKDRSTSPGDRMYGWEYDLMLFYEYNKNITFSVEGDYFQPGDFFGDEIDPVTKVGIGIDVNF